MARSFLRTPGGRATTLVAAALLLTAALAVLAYFAPPAEASKPGGVGGGGTPPAAGPLHSGDLDGATRVGKTGWSARVTVTVHDASEQPVSGVTVTGRWSGGVDGTGACLTGRRGTCTMQSSRAALDASGITFEVTGLTLGGSTYDAVANHDADGDSDGTTIVVTK